MLKLGELAERALAELEEAGSDNIFALLNTIIAPQGHTSEIDEFRIALSSLLAHDLVTLEIARFGHRNAEQLTREQSATVLGTLEQWFRNDPALRSWRLREGDMRHESFPAVRLTLQGRTQSEVVLDAKGYRWWRRH